LGTRRHNRADSKRGTASDQWKENIGKVTGLHKRTQEDEEWFVARRFLKAALKGRIFEPPLSIQKRNPPEPDFSLELGDGGGYLAFLEITSYRPCRPEGNDKVRVQQQVSYVTWRFWWTIFSGCKSTRTGLGVRCFRCDKTKARQRYLSTIGCYAAFTQLPKF